eukprot:CAMPEP_0197690874 /NCGR_PEP_ID=MMETSP1338-20131121/108959_1 /TAXON_ID=43686 ORGANISM="Pelagodinium beii, Strain RCC1491" /NCGR_SAMPLE_ID=MMETSP1338 /ASSEMBLY_ACC=CAM_ASM_000754 /LENGTH=680 /DNA_ID=CAMNT_0043273365 /DNA_START=116 /DNA_END=2158 /DNA_ORIENTATION=+
MVVDNGNRGWRLSEWIAQADWVVQQKNPLNIQAVVHVGDLVNVATVHYEWENFNKGWQKIEQTGVAWSLVPGNHDLNTMACWDCADRWDIYNQKMTAAWQRNKHLEESYPPGRYENSMVIFEASGIEFMILSIELGPGATPSSEGTLDWASSKLRQHPERRAIINNHFGVWGTERREVVSIAEWSKQHRNIFLIHQGHDCAREWNKIIYNNWGEPIMEVLTDYQCSGDAFLRYYSFHLDAREIQAYTYSPVLLQFERDSNSEFAFPFEPETPSGAPKPQNIYERVDGVGGWGGWCVCPDGKRYNVGDRNDACENGPSSLACIGGVPGECLEVHDASREGMQVTCVASNASATTSATRSTTTSATSLTSTLPTTTLGPESTTSSVRDTCYGHLEAVAAEEGDEIGSKVETLSLQECQNACTNVNECQSFAFCPHFDGCWMKTKVLTGSEPTRNFYDCKTYYKKRCESTIPPSTESTTRSSISQTTLEATSSTTTTSSFTKVFWEFDGGEGRACRGSSSSDASDAYYVLFTGVPLDECKAKCVAEPLCKGLEHNPNGRCEVWTRTEGIEASAPVAGYTCFVYGGPPVTTSPAILTDFSPVDGGEGRACRGASENDNSAEYYNLFTSVPSMEDCMHKCANQPKCKGIEHHGNGRCEVWTRPEGIQASFPVSGYTCLAYRLAIK